MVPAVPCAIAGSRRIPGGGTMLCHPELPFSRSASPPSRRVVRRASLRRLDNAPLGPDYPQVRRPEMPVGPGDGVAGARFPVGPLRGAGRTHTREGNSCQR